MSTLRIDPTRLEQFHAEDGVWEGKVTNPDGTNPDLTAPGVALTLTLATAPGATALVTKSLGSGVTGAADGSYSITVAQADINAQAQGATLAYLILYQAASGRKTVLAHGVYELIAS